MHGGFLVVSVLLALAAGCGDDRTVEATAGQTTDARTTEKTDAPSTEAVGTTDHARAFSIYLASEPAMTAIDLEQAELEALELRSEPLLTANDIRSYCWQDHSFTLTDDAKVVFPTPGVFGVPFVVLSNGERQYLGALWSTLSSVMYSEPTIVVDADDSSRTYAIAPALRDSLDDPRAKVPIREALQAAGKLDPPCPQLSPMMKGYELYSWKPDGGDWHFSLVVGTNRNKTCFEIKVGTTARQAVGVDAAKALLARLPPGESVGWRASAGASPEEEDCGFSFPEPTIVADLEAYCEALGVKLLR